MIIKPTDLSPGNYFNYYPSLKNKLEKTIHVIDSSDIKLAEENDAEFNKYYKPIPITKEIMVGLDFNLFIWNGHIHDYNIPLYKKDNGCKISLWFGMYIDEPDGLADVRITSSGSGDIYSFNHIKYLHQLQGFCYNVGQRELKLSKKYLLKQQTLAD